MRPGRKRLLLDTNILLLWLVARTNARLLTEFKRVHQFSYRDIVQLRDIVSRHSAHVSTPHVLSETSNFIDQAPNHRRAMLVDDLRRYIGEVQEVFVPAGTLVATAEFDRFGLADTGLWSLRNEAVIVTADRRLAGRITADGAEAIHFNF